MSNSETEQATPETVVRVSNISSASSSFSGYLSAVVAAAMVGGCVGPSIDRAGDKIASAIDKNTEAVEANTSAIKNQQLTCPRL